jgi:GTPase SAR1 family protein
LFDSAEQYCYNLKYSFLDQIPEIRKKSYIPTLQDMLLYRKKSIGVTEITITHKNQKKKNKKNKKIRLIDVGGQRTERRKWLHCFDMVNYVVFLASLSEFDQVCYEDHQTKRLEESLIIWQGMLNHESFTKTPFCMVFTKNDLFEKKIKQGARVEKYLKGFKPKENISEEEYIEEARKYICSLYLKDIKREILTYNVICINTESVKENFTNFFELIK